MRVTWGRASRWRSSRRAAETRWAADGQLLAAVAVGFGAAVATVGEGVGLGVDVRVGRGVGEDDTVAVGLGGTGPRGAADGLAVGSPGVATDLGRTVELPPLFEIAPATATPAIATPATASTVSAAPRSPARAMNRRRRFGCRVGWGRLPRISCRRRDIAHPSTIRDFRGGYGGDRPVACQMPKTHPNG